MPIGPNGEKRPPAVTANAVRSMQVATGQADETIVKSAAPTAGYQGVRLSGRRPSRITMLAAIARWGPRPPQRMARGG